MATRRSKTKHPNLKKQYTSRVRQEYIDQDYIDKLSEEQKDYLNKFNGEYYGAAMDFVNLENNLHNTKELKEDCTDRNNHQNNDVYGVAKAQNRINDIKMMTIQKESVNIDFGQNDDKGSDPNIENYLIDYIDSKKISDDT